MRFTIISYIVCLLLVCRISAVNTFRIQSATSRSDPRNGCLGRDSSRDASNHRRRYVKQRYRHRPRRQAQRNDADADADVDESDAGPIDYLPAPLEGLLLSGNSSTNGFLLRYADLRPYDETSLVGLLFLATNIVYAFVGAVLLFGDGASMQRQVFGVVMEIAGVVSLYYHWAQLKFGGSSKKEVLAALVLDYGVATLCIACFIKDVVLQLMDDLPTITMCAIDTAALQQLIELSSCRSAAVGALAMLSLFGSWKFEYGLPYMVFHGLWHVLSALAASLLYTLH